ncbi:homoserine O-acetyltransferase [Planctomycetota bacterium]
MGDDSIGIVATEVREIELPAEGFRLEKGGALPRLEVAFERYGALSESGDNVILICHALSGDAHAAGIHSKEDRKPGWWDLMIGPGKGIDTDRFHVICTNFLGGCKGTTGPSSQNPETGQPYGSDFPEITIGDMVKVQKLLLEDLGIEKLHGVIGGSAGGLQVLEWAVRYPGMVCNAVCIAAAESLSAQALSFDIIARKIIMADPRWKDGHYDAKDLPEQGLSLARMIGHITYLSKESMDRKFGRERREDMEATAFNTDFQIESYLNYQGTSFVDRFDANSFLYITAAMNSFALTDRDPDLEQVFKETAARFLIISVDSDWLYPEEQSKELAESLLRAGKEVTYCNLTAPYGHDSFLLENDDLTGLLASFFQGKPSRDSRDGSVDFRRDLDIVRKMIEPGSSVLDLGCGDGGFLADLLAEEGYSGHGVDIDVVNIVKCNTREVPTFQMDLDQGLGMIPDGHYDYAVLSGTLLEVHKPHQLLEEMVRVARMGILTFPNFANIGHRLRLGFKGRLPRAGALPYEWYDTPNIHFLTLRDFKVFCREKDIDIVDISCIPDGWLSRLLVKMKWCNLGAGRVVVKIARKGTVPKVDHGCRVCQD